MSHEKEVLEGTLLKRLGLEKVRVWVGVLAWRGRSGKIVGNKKLFAELQKALLPLGGISYIITPHQSLEDDWLKGYLYVPSEDSWIFTEFPIPDVIYNRVPFYHNEKEKCFIQFRESAKQKGIPIFNSHFLDKWSTYQLLSARTSIQNFLPETLEVTNEEDCLQFIRTHICIYAKPKLKSKGFGVMRIRLKHDGKIYCETTSTTILFANFERFWERFQTTFEKNQYILQQAIEPKTYKGRRFDLRVLGQYNGTTYEVTGIGVRQSFHQEITTHVPRGGRILPLSAVEHLVPDKLIDQLVIDIGEELNKDSDLFYEFSIDMGLDEEHTPYVFEVNAKPMTFDEEEIESKRMELLSELFLTLSKQGPTT